EDVELLRMMEEIGQETLETFSTHDFLLVSLVHRDQPVPDRLRGRVARLLELGILERAGRSRLVIGSRYYRRIGRAGAYTRKRGLQRETKKELILQHIRQNKDRGTRLGELLDALPGESRSQVQVYLRELREAGRIYVTGATSGARWYPASDDGE
ncbi:MAG: transcriptional regulator, partial [Spirochaetaceae bacterium]